MRNSTFPTGKDVPSCKAIPNSDPAQIIWYSGVSSQKCYRAGESFWNFLNLIEYDQSVFRIDFLSRIDLNAAKDTLRIKIAENNSATRAFESKLI